MKTLLIAAESPLLGSALTQALPQYRVSCCASGADALALLEALRPEILITELSLPVVCGLTVLHTTSYKPPVILGLTNLITTHVLLEAAQAGVQELLLLPCSTRQIIDRLNRLLEKAPSSEG